MSEHPAGEDAEAAPTAAATSPSRGQRPAGIDWRRMLAEGLLIVGSVYLAIYLEGVRDQRERVDEARIALGQLGGDLREDRRDLQEIVAEQHRLNGLYTDLERWLGTPGAMPFDSVGSALEYIASTNRTMFPRKGAWTTMLAEGYLGALDDPELVARLGTFYGRINERVEYNGAYYDTFLSDLIAGTIPTAWDFHARRPTGDPERLRLLRNQLRLARIVWNEYYIGLLDEYQREIDRLIESVGSYLAGRAVDPPSGTP